jgi:hypothetical protein
MPAKVSIFPEVRLYDRLVLGLFRFEARDDAADRCGYRWQDDEHNEIGYGRADADKNTETSSRWKTGKKKQHKARRDD